MFQETNARMKSAATLLLSSLCSDPDVAQKVLQNKAIAVLASAMPALLLHDDVRVQTVVARVISALLRRADLGAQVLQAGNAGGAGGVLEAVELLLQSKVEDLKLAAGSILETALQYHVEQGPRVLARPRLLAALLRAPVEAVRGERQTPSLSCAPQGCSECCCVLLPTAMRLLFWRRLWWRLPPFITLCICPSLCLGI
ncbi:MAG: hypothetical protein ACPIOQ_41450 [Promethearchaeia archaeon]